MAFNKFGQMNLRARKFRTGHAIAAIVASVFALSLGDAAIKASSVSLSLWQVLVLRSLIALPILLLILFRRPRTPMGPPAWIALRSALLLLMWLCYYAALPLMPLTLAATAFYTSPILITVLSPVLLRRWPPARAQIAVALGFVGVVLILRPDAVGFQVETLLPVLAAFLYAIAMLLTSTKCKYSDPIALAIALNIALIVGGGILAFWSSSEGSFLFGAWRPLTSELLGMMTLLAAAIVIGSVGAAIAYQNGPPATVATFDYSYLVFSLIWGGLFFSEMPDGLSLLGIGVIVFAGVLSLPKAVAGGV